MLAASTHVRSVEAGERSAAIGFPTASRSNRKAHPAWALAGEHARREIWSRRFGRIPADVRGTQLRVEAFAGLRGGLYQQRSSGVRPVPAGHKLQARRARGAVTRESRHTQPVAYGEGSRMAADRGYAQPSPPVATERVHVVARALGPRAEPAVGGVDDLEQFLRTSLTI